MTMSEVCETVENVVEVDATEFTDFERQLILQVVARDEDIRVQENTRLHNLKEQLRHLREMGVPDEEEECYGHVCKRCRTPFKLFFNSAAQCPNCAKKVCKECRIPLKTCGYDIVLWTCTLCCKYKDIRAESGAWFYSAPDHHPTVKTTEVYGSMMMKRIFSVLKKQDYMIYKDPVWNEIVQVEESANKRDDYLVISSKTEGDDYLVISSKTGGDYAVEEVAAAHVQGSKTCHVVFQDVEGEYVEVISETLEEVETMEVPETVSLLSDTSEDGEGKLFDTSAGEVQIDFKYDHDKNMFEIQLHRAVNLVFVDVNKLSADPYAKVYLTSAARQHGKMKTKVIKNTLSPDFDEVLYFNIEHEELVTCTCNISVWHYEFSNNNVPLGEVEINIEEFLGSGFSLEHPIPQWYTLHMNKCKLSQLSFCGEVVVSLQYKAPGSMVADTKREQRKLPNPTKGELNINLVQAKGLNSEHETVYCKISLVLSEKNTRKVKSKIAYSSTDPYWDEEFTIDNISWSQLERSYLQICVRGGQKDSVFIGGTRLGLGKYGDAKHDSFGEEVRVWQSMLDHTNELQTFCLPLRNSLRSVKQDLVVPQKQVKEITDEEYDSIKTSFRSSTKSQRFLNSDTASLRSGSGSLLSMYSNAGGQTGGLVITGEILLSMKHDVSSNVFSVCIEKAKCIAAVNTKHQTSDPYCKVYLFPDPTKSTKQKTTHRRKTVNPRWNEMLTYNITRDNLLKKTLQVSIWNHDRFGRNDFLGEVQVNIAHYTSTNNMNTQTPVWYTLQEMNPITIGPANESKGEVKIGVRFDHEVLHVHIIEANGLYAVDPDHLPDPFIECYLLPDKSEGSKRKTVAQKKTITPVWNERFEYKNVEVDDLYSRALELTVWDHNTSGHQFLGGVRLGFPHGDENWHDCFGKEVDIWESMMKHLGILAEHTLSLRSTMTSRKVHTTEQLATITPILEDDERIMSITSEHLTDVPMIRLSLQYLEPNETEEEKKKKKKAKGCLKVVVKEGKNLPYMSEEDVPSTFCKGFIYPKRKGYKMKTETYIKSADPVWDTEMLFEGVSLEELRYRALEIVVYDEINEKEKEMIGYVRLGSGQYIEKWDDSTGMEIEIWQSMLNNPSTSIMTTLPLRVAQEDVFAVVEEDFVDYYSEDEGSLVNEENEEDDVDVVPGGESPRTAALRAMGLQKTSLFALTKEEEVAGDEREEAFVGECEVVCEPQLSQPPSSSEQIQPGQPSASEQIQPGQLSSSEQIQPGQPPFFGAGMENEQDLEEEYKLKQDKKKPFSLLKRSASEESISSTSSTGSTHVYGHVPVRGDVQFGMKYDFSSNTFEVHIFQAKDIASVDTKKEISDPYCKVYLLPDKTKSGKKKTTTRKKTLQPEWEEILEYKVTVRDLRTRTLWVALWHLERFGRNIFLGEVMLNMDSVIDGNDDLGTSTPRWYPLRDKGHAPVTNLFKGEIRFSIKFEDSSMFSKETREQAQHETTGNNRKRKKVKHEGRKGTGKINVHIKECSDLPASDMNGASDPFCKCYLLPMKSMKSKRKTPTIRHTMNPVWDYKFEYVVDYEDLADHGIEFTVWDWDRGTRNDFLGCCRINLGTHEDQWNDAEEVEIEAWQHLIDSPNTWKEFVIPLRSKMDPKCAHVK